MTIAGLRAAAATLLVVSAVGPAAAQGIVMRPTLSLELARTLADRALACAVGRGYEVAITVVDGAGQDLVFLRTINANPHTAENSRRKAYTARTFRMSSAQFAAAWFANDRTRVPQATLPGVIALAGGLPINAAGATVGAIGISGSPGGENDELCAQQGLDAIAGQLRVAP